MANVFVTDQYTADDLEDDLDLQTCLNNPRVTKVTIYPDGTLVAELGQPSAPDDIILKSAPSYNDKATGFRGVSMRGDKYRVRISEGGLDRNVGTYETMEQAVEARIKAELGVL